MSLSPRHPRQVPSPLPALGELSLGGNSTEETESNGHAAEPTITRPLTRNEDVEVDAEDIAASMDRNLDDLVEHTGNHGTGHKIYKPLEFQEFLQVTRAHYESAEPDHKHNAHLVSSTINAPEAKPSWAPTNTEKYYYDRAQVTTLSIEAATEEWKELFLSDATAITRASQFDLIGSISTSVDILVEVGKFLDPRDIVNLYSISRDFHATLNTHLQSCVIAWVRLYSAVGGRIYTSGFYRPWFIRDPAGRPRDRNAHDMSYITQPEKVLPPITDNVVRLVPGLRWLQLVVNRANRARDILAVLARNGHRTPPETHGVLLKLWMLMDIATSRARLSVLRQQRFFPDEDLVLAHTFFIKLRLLFNDPIIGPGSSTLLKVMLGQRSLSTLWAFLRRKQYATRYEVATLKIRYDVGPNPSQIANGYPVNGVPLTEMGIGHLEAWGEGYDHLLRPDEVVFIESERRQLDIASFIRKMMLYGHVDLRTGSTLVPTLDEMYMSDYDLPSGGYNDPMRNAHVLGRCGNVAFDRRNWQPQHARKFAWEKLSDEQKRALLTESAKQIGDDWAAEFTRNSYEVAKDKLERELKNWLGERGNCKYIRTRLPAGIPENSEADKTDHEHNGGGESADSSEYGCDRSERGNDSSWENRQEAVDPMEVDSDSSSEPARDEHGQILNPFGNVDALQPGPPVPVQIFAAPPMAGPFLMPALFDEENEGGADREPGHEETGRGGNKEQYEGKELENAGDEESRDPKIFDENGRRRDDGEDAYDADSETSEPVDLSSLNIQDQLTFDDYLLSLGDEEYDEEEVGFDWEGRIRALTIDDPRPDIVTYGDIEMQPRIKIKLANEETEADATLRDHARLW